MCACFSFFSQAVGVCKSPSKSTGVLEAKQPTMAARVCLQLSASVQIGELGEDVASHVKSTKQQAFLFRNVTFLNYSSPALYLPCILQIFHPRCGRIFSVPVILWYADMHILLRSITLSSKGPLLRGLVLGPWLKTQNQSLAFSVDAEENHHSATMNILPCYRQSGSI